MECTFINEPELEFGNGNHIDIRFGLSRCGTLDSAGNTGLSRVRLGLIGDQESVTQFRIWLDRCRDGIAAKQSPLRTLFPAFPGFGEGRTFCDFLAEETSCRVVNSRDCKQLETISDRDELVAASVDRFVTEAADLLESTKIDVVLCLPWSALLSRIDTGKTPIAVGLQRRSNTSRPRPIVWHDLMKAKAMSLKVPIQVCRPATYGGKVHHFALDGTPKKDIEDEASRAWNFFSALYYKAGGIPWRLPRRSADLTTCFVGVSYFHQVGRDSVEASVAQVFNERGEGVVVRGGQALVEKADRSLHLDQESAAALLRDALASYRKTHRTLPARVVCHKSRYFDDGETAGFEKAAEEMCIDQLDLVSLRRSSMRFFRNKPNPPLRGTVIHLEDSRSLIYTQGSVDFYRTYPGMRVPRPLEVSFDRIDSAKPTLLEEILALTKMNWNSTRFINTEPITLAAARSVGEVLRYLDEKQEITARYSYYM